MTESDFQRVETILKEAEEVVHRDAEEHVGRLLDPDKRLISDARFMALCSVIQKWAPDYNPAFQTTDISPASMKRLFSNPDNVFLHGLLLEQKGTCTNMPLFYVVVAERLGWPVYGVSIGAHLFVRWDGPHYRMNFEPTVTQFVAMTPEDDTYLEPGGLT